MDDLVSAMLALALTSVTLVAGQRYLSSKSDIPAATSASQSPAAAIISPAFAR
jgi:hypothetical protein